MHSTVFTKFSKSQYNTVMALRNGAKSRMGEEKEKGLTEACARERRKEEGERERRKRKGKRKI
jgi:hypothetical protein